MMDCKAIQQAIYRFVYGEGHEEELQRIKMHLDGCQECRAEKALVDSILAKLHAHAADERSTPLPDGCHERMRNVIHSRLATPSMDNHGLEHQQRTG
jgi:predicted anti-sigma-YlaC factor YlaD